MGTPLAAKAKAAWPSVDCCRAADAARPWQADGRGVGTRRLLMTAAAGQLAGRRRTWPAGWGQRQRGVPLAQHRKVHLTQRTLPPHALIVVGAERGPCAAVALRREGAGGARRSTWWKRGSVRRPANRAWQRRTGASRCRSSGRSGPSPGPARTAGGKRVVPPDGGTGSAAGQPPESARPGSPGGAPRQRQSAARRPAA